MIDGRDKLKVKGKIIIFKLGKDGSYNKVYEKFNLVVDTGLDFLAELMKSGSILGYTAVGTNPTPVTSTDTSLYAELDRNAFEDTDALAGGIFRADTRFGVSEAVGAWEEAGMFQDAVAGVMFNRVNITFTKNAGDVVIVRFEITFT